MNRSRRGTTIAEVVIAFIIALLVLALVMAFLRSTRLHEARTATRLDRLTGSTRFTRALAQDLRAAYATASDLPRVAAGGRGLSLDVCRGLPAHPGGAPELVAVTYACDTAGTLIRTEAGTSMVVARMPGGRVTFSTTSESGTLVVRAVVEPGPGARPVVVERVLCTATATPGSAQWIGPGAPAPVAPAPAD